MGDADSVPRRAMREPVTTMSLAYGAPSWGSASVEVVGATECGGVASITDVHAMPGAGVDPSAHAVPPPCGLAVCALAVPPAARTSVIAVAHALYAKNQRNFTILEDPVYPIVSLL